MLIKQNYTPFKVKTVSLSGSNLIEASAGTGKTYSIAILLLRLLLEKKISITEILMVTFTKAAVAELEERIRLFVRDADRFAKGEIIEDSLIKELVDKAKSEIGEEEVRRVLSSAVLNLDETSVLTIHSFCQNTLNEFAFETNQLFHAELVQDMGSMIEEEIQKFWRKNITTIQLDLLHALIEVGLTQAGIMAIVKEHLNGKSYFSFNPSEPYYFGSKKQKEFLEVISISKLKKEEANNSLINYLSENKNDTESLCTTDANAKKHLLHLLLKPEEFLRAIRLKSGTKYVQKLFPELLEKIKLADEALEDYIESTEKCLDYLYSFAIKEIILGIRKFKLSNNQMGFDDLISNLHSALVDRENNDLKLLLSAKYKAVFIDEFQDTDKMQYEIFHKAFHDASILFYIGDPKQSIYAWRKADIATYFKARTDVDEKYSMNVNFRSTKALIDAMNQFFLPKLEEGQFDTFYYGEAAAEDRIDYHPVDAPKTEDKGQLIINGQECVPITFNNLPNKPAIAESIGNQILDLLINPNHSIADAKTKQPRRILASDIGILVRAKKDGFILKNTLSKLGIPAVTVTDAKVLDSEEALHLLYVLDAIINNTRSKINRALLSSFTNWKTEMVLKLNEDVVIQKFRAYKEKWRVHGIYAALMDFISDFKVQQKLIDQHAENGERILTNLYHLLEILYKTESRQHLSPIELLDWLKRSQIKEADGDEMEQRIENDEDAVKIVTIHSSKGLQYPIVFAPYLDFNYNTKADIVSFRDEESGVYKVAKTKQLTEEQLAAHKRQDEQENRRLLYVAITRAVFKCFIYKNLFYKDSTLSIFQNAIQESKVLQESDLIKEEHPVFNHQDVIYTAQQVQTQKALFADPFNLSGNNWMRMSYSGLAAKNEIAIKDRYQATKEGYDYFIFQELQKGAKTGNFLHFIFENLDFSKMDAWPFVVQKAMNRFLPTVEEHFENKVQQMLTHVFQATLSTQQISFPLSIIPPANCIHELEFDFPVSLFTPGVLSDLNANGIAITDKIWGQIEGIMNGKIDLFFEHDNKYFVLDWKSTYLGPDVRNYDSASLLEAMGEHNYHLQYLIYTLAVKKYLETRMGATFDYERDFGGVFYLFVRGMRAEKESGVFYIKPELGLVDRLEKVFSQ